MPFTSKKRNVKHSTGIGYDFLPSCFDEFCVEKISFFAGKSLILECLKERGERVLHLEELANHKGSVLG